MTITIMIADPDIQRRQLIRNRINAAARILYCADIKEGIYRLSNGDIQVVAANQKLGGIGGLDLITMLKVNNPEIVIIPYTDSEIEHADPSYWRGWQHIIQNAAFKEGGQELDINSYFGAPFSLN